LFFGKMAMTLTRLVRELGVMVVAIARPTAYRFDANILPVSIPEYGR
jgi:hypothetical protein